MMRLVGKEVKDVRVYMLSFYLVKGRDRYELFWKVNVLNRKKWFIYINRFKDINIYCKWVG